MLQIRTALLWISSVCLPNKSSFKTIVAARGGLESRPLRPCHARVYARARTHPRPCAPPRPVLLAEVSSPVAGLLRWVAFVKLFLLKLLLYFT